MDSMHVKKPNRPPTRRNLLLGGLGLAAAGRAAWASGPKLRRIAMRFAGTVRAPEFPTGLDWINTSAPLTLPMLRGKVVLLDFWTYC